MQTKKILSLTLCSIITALLVVAMVVLLLCGYFKKADERIEISSVSVSQASSNYNYIFNTSFTIRNISEENVYLTNSYVRIVVKNSSGKIVDCYTNKISKTIYSGSFENFYISSRKIIEFNANEDYTAEVSFVDPKLYSFGYALIPFIIIGAYGIVASAVSFRHSKQTNANKEESEIKNNNDINNQKLETKNNALNNDINNESINKEVLGSENENIEKSKNSKIKNSKQKLDNNFKTKENENANLIANDENVKTETEKGNKTTANKIKTKKTQKSN